MSTYILQKDLPDAKAGTEFIYDNASTYIYDCSDGTNGYYQKNYIENNPDWFKPKQQSNKDWVIVSLKYKSDGKVYPFTSLNNQELFDIHSVRRLSDNEVFTIGDEVCDIDNVRYRGKINKIEIQYGALVVEIGEKRWLLLTHLIKVFKSPLFKTEDGKDIYQGDSYWVVYSDTFQIDNGIAFGNKGYYLSSGVKILYFSTEDAAKEYILLNKPCFSISDVMLECEKYSFHTRPHDRFDEDYWAIYNLVLKEKLQQLAQKKINNTK